MSAKLGYIIVIIFFFLSGCRKDTASPEQEKDLNHWLELAGDASYGSGQWLAVLDSAILYYPHAAEPYYRKAVRLIRQHDYINGMSNLTKAASLDPATYSNYLGLIKLMNLRDYEGAVASFQKAISAGAMNDPIISGHAKLRLGLAYKGLGKYDEALANFNEYIEETGPNNVVVYTFVHRGLTFELKGDYFSAEKDYRKAIDLWPKCTEAYYYLGRLQEKTGKKDAACRNSQKAMLYKGFIRTNPSRAYIDQVYYADLENLFDKTCK